MYGIDRYIARTVVNDLIDRLIDECVSKKEIVEILDESLTEEGKEYFDVKWLEKDD